MSAPRSTPTRSDAGAGAPSAAELALCRSMMWEALALGFRAPTEATVARLASAPGAAALAVAAAALDVAEGSALAPVVRALGRTPAPDLVSLGTAYAHLFGHTARGRVTPYETEYGADSLWEPQREMSDLGGFFRAFGLRLAPAAHERADHVACECEFLMFLARKAARALAVGDHEMYAATARAERLFLRDHLGRWAPALGLQLQRADDGGFFGALGRLCAAFVTAECQRLGVAAGPDLLPLRRAEPEAAPMGCGPVGCEPDG